MHLTNWFFTTHNQQQERTYGKNVLRTLVRFYTKEQSSAKTILI